MRDSLPSARYSPICNVLRQWKTSLIPIYRVYRLYDTYIIVHKDSCNFIETSPVPRTWKFLDSRAHRVNVSSTLFIDIINLNYSRDLDF